MEKKSITFYALLFLLGIATLSTMVCCTDSKSAKPKTIVTTPKTVVTAPKTPKIESSRRIVNRLILEYPESYTVKQNRHYVILEDECELRYDASNGQFMVFSDNVTLMRRVAKQLDSIGAWYTVVKPVDCITIRYYKQYIPNIQN